MHLKGHRVGQKRVARLMAENGVLGTHTRKKWRKGRTDVGSSPDLVNGDFTADRPDELWVADITEFSTHQGLL